MSEQKTPPFGIPYEVEKFFENKILKVGELSDHKVIAMNTNIT